MLFEDFYELQSIENTGSGTYTARIFLNASHDIFKGHFPGNPVTPGVCMMQVIKEVTQQIVEAPLVLQSASNVKFTALINPEVNPALKLEIEVLKTDEGMIKVKNSSYFDDTLALKLGCIYRLK